MIVKLPVSESSGTASASMVVRGVTDTTAQEPSVQKLAAASGLESLTVNTLCKWDSSTSKMVAITLASDLPTHVYYAGTYASGFAQFGVLGYRGVVSKIVAAGAVTIGDLVYVAASAKVATLSATAGTYYQIGQALTAATADGDEIKINTCIPHAVIVE